MDMHKETNLPDLMRIHSRVIVKDIELGVLIEDLATVLEKLEDSIIDPSKDHEYQHCAEDFKRKYIGELNRSRLGRFAKLVKDMKMKINYQFDVYSKDLETYRLVSKEQDEKGQIDDVARHKIEVDQGYIKRTEQLQREIELE